MPIFDRDPADWSDLQNLVGQLFDELGCEVAVGKVVQLARGQKEIDVWVRDATAIPPILVLIECKFWARPVSQETVHSFRTVVSEAGANRGYVVSRAGFQSGAFEAAKLSNIELVTFAGLQELFFDRWKVAIAQRMMPYVDRLFPYWDPTGGRMPSIPWDDSHRARHRRLMEVYAPLIDLGPQMASTGFSWRLPIDIPAEPVESEARVTLSTYRQVYDFIENNKDRALADFQRVHGETPTASGAEEGAG